MPSAAFAGATLGRPLNQDVRVQELALINEYLETRLLRRLSSHGLPPDLASPFLDDVRTRLQSVISRWNDPEARNALLILGEEEATFYEPKTAPLAIRCLVVVAIRNSLLEDLSGSREWTKRYSDELARTIPRGGLIPNSQLRHLTEEAIDYFGSVDLEPVARAVPLPDSDPFAVLEHMPAAWTALKHLATLSSAKLNSRYEPIKPEPVDLAPFVSGQGGNVGYAVHQSGIDERIPRVIYDALVKGPDGTEVITDCFKLITRNPAKLGRLIEYHFARGQRVVTANYFLANGYVARRSQLLRPAHSAWREEDSAEKMTNLQGLLAEHREAWSQGAALLLPPAKESLEIGKVGRSRSVAFYRRDLEGGHGLQFQQLRRAIQQGKIDEVHVTWLRVLGAKPERVLSFIEDAKRKRVQVRVIRGPLAGKDAGDLLAYARERTARGEPIDDHLQDKQTGPDLDETLNHLVR